MKIKLTLAPVWIGGKKHWIVQDGDRSKVSAAFHTKEEAQERRDQLIEADRQKRAVRKRPCMCCGNVFPSEGIHNRLCSYCRQHEGRVFW